jgi:hypothetical protein
MAQFAQGYERTPQSAMAILDFLEQHFPVNTFMKNVIVELYNEICALENANGENL